MALLDQYTINHHFKVMIYKTDYVFCDSIFCSLEDDIRVTLS